MGKFLVIVESPTKAKTINRYLGRNYIVKSSFGHIRDLSSSNISGKKSSSGIAKKKIINCLKKKDILINRIGIDPYNGWLAKYEILPGKLEIIHELNVLAKNSDHIYLATDLDREGEAIAWHLKEVIQLDDTRISRVVFNEITYNSITKAFKYPTLLNINKVHAQQARRFMDRLVGYMLSPLLWKKIARGLSAGRVQSVVVRLIVDRERKIKSFIPKTYWILHVDLMSVSKKKLTFQVIHDGVSRFIPNTEEEVRKAKGILSQSTSYIIHDRVDKYFFNKPNPPFITSTLQQVASSKLGYSIKKTMLLAQRLYEAGYITYMRTNSFNVGQDALTAVRSYIHDIYGQEYLPNEINRYRSKYLTEDAHEAIRPSDVYLLAKLIKGTDSTLKKLYHLIWSRFIASQMKSSQYIVINLIIKMGNFQLRASNRISCFDGWEKIMSEFDNCKEEKNDIFLDCKKGDLLSLKNISSTQHFTKPPSRYNEASLVKELERRGIGRPSTYVLIISTIQNRGYVYLYNSHFYATKIGEIVTDRLFENFYELMDYQFTANMENILDKIADNKKEWKSVLDDFFKRLSKKLDIAEKSFKDGGMRPNSVVATSIICSLCQKNMGIRTGITGVFLSCEGYNDVSFSKNRCKNTMNLIPDIAEKNINIQSNFFYCKECNKIMDKYFIDNHRKLHICTNSPLCHGYKVENGTFFTQGCSDLVIQCEKCFQKMNLKFGRFGKYMSCSNLTCKNTRKILNDAVVQKPLFISFPELLCKKSNAHFVLRNGKLGIFFAANTFPQSRETRAPLIEELVRFRDRLPETLAYLADAPMYDDCGNKTLVRFNRKNKQQYINSEKNGKFTAWKAFFINDRWEVTKE